MTQSLSKVKRRTGNDQAAAVADDNQAVDAARATLPIAGLALGQPVSLGTGLPSVAEPLPVIDALRRQVIRRSSETITMDLGSEDDDDEVAAYEGTAEEAAAHLVSWLRGEAGDATNYTVAVHDDDIYISKVNGVTSATALMIELKAEIEEHGIEQSFNIYLCQKFNTSAPSNHAEMCVLAAIGEANVGEITFLECTAPSCDFCAATLTHYGVPNTSPDGEPASQQGWVHPFVRLSFGTQLGDHQTQVTELTDYLADPTTTLVLGRTTGTVPSGRSTHWL
ncbi:MAG: hypothetical protein QOE53_1966 [Pseudonocardiales bacterium]|nr:hypothetical protein [Pseudonocardiales bacterium]